MHRIALGLLMAVASMIGLWSVDALAAEAPSTITCSRVIIPACGTVNGVQQSFRNACAAHRAGATDIVAGNCRAKQVFCAMIYLPVCGVKNGHPQTYSNACVANNAGAKIISKGQCGDD